jgi:hypothetical protein
MRMEVRYDEKWNGGWSNFRVQGRYVEMGCVLMDSIEGIGSASFESVFEAVITSREAPLFGKKAKV